ncbi:DUF2218 domain-containing protein [Shewanella frigidimarina]|uniref:DUF2218 domain-containing protein n=1 Tax=Shewanella frigidimarina TaxID=56812 RepID=UPI003D79F86F
MITETFLETEQGKLYLNKLCKYFARQVPVSLIGLQGRIDLPCGLCRIRVTDLHMHFHIAVVNDQDTDRAERLVTQPLSRITGKDKLLFQWKRHH